MDTFWEAFAVALASGTVTGCLSLVGSLVLSKRSSTVQMQTSALSAYLSARLDAYRDFETALESWSNSPTKETCAGVYHAVNVAALVAGDDTISLLGELQASVRNYELHGIIPDAVEFSRVKVKLTKAMRNDLQTFTVPSVLKRSRKQSTR